MELKITEEIKWGNYKVTVFFLTASYYNDIVMENKSFALNILNGIYKQTNKLFINSFKKVGWNWLEVRKIKNLPEDELHTVNFLDNRISFRSRDEFLHSVEEIFLEDIYKQQLKPKPFIIDCGANIGLSVIYLKRLFPDATIIAFEPDDTNFDLLTRNINAFGFSNVDLRKEAIWNENTYLNFLSEGSLMSRIENEPQKSTIKVKATRLNDLMNQPIDFLKIDIEGAEYQVIKDIESKLPLVQNLFVEYHGTFAQNQELNHLLQIITSNGFQYYIKHAIDKHPTPFIRTPTIDYDNQLNIFAFR